jgi:hypothetical protein
MTFLQCIWISIEDGKGEHMKEVQAYSLGFMSAVNECGGLFAATTRPGATD